MLMRVSAVLIALAIVSSASRSPAQPRDLSQDQGTSGLLPRPNYRECFSGSAAACITEARKALQNVPQQSVDAIALFGKACELGEAMGCEETARLYQASNSQEQAQRFIERAAALRRMSALSDPARTKEEVDAPRARERSPNFFTTSPEGMLILKRRVERSTELLAVGGILLGAGVLLSLGGFATLNKPETLSGGSYCSLCGIVLPGIGLPHFVLPGAIMLTVGVIQQRRNKRILASARALGGTIPRQQNPRVSEPSTLDAQSIDPEQNPHVPTPVELGEEPLTQEQVARRLLNAQILTGIGGAVLGIGAAMIVGSAVRIHYGTNNLPAWCALGVGAGLFPAAIPMIAVGGHRIGVYRRMLAAQPGKMALAPSASASLQVTPVLQPNELGLRLSGHF